jgi:hypothetical protein
MAEPRPTWCPSAAAEEPLPAVQPQAVRRLLGPEVRLQVERLLARLVSASPARSS